MYYCSLFSYINHHLRLFFLKDSFSIVIVIGNPPSIILNYENGPASTTVLFHFYFCTPPFNNAGIICMSLSPSLQALATY
ncbi:hypothetical protein RJT34_19339 [Clitoria ternatea]|uniref:Uncharacterized protein n=1 Tax=Clitoria ternatea TaxID=43366 RepID=A0AAN9IQU6_CLITE